jgi:hypothetical protein
VAGQALGLRLRNPADTACGLSWPSNHGLGAPALPGGVGEDGDGWGVDLTIDRRGRLARAMLASEAFYIALADRPDLSPAKLPDQRGQIVPFPALLHIANGASANVREALSPWIARSRTCAARRARSS